MKNEDKRKNKGKLKYIGVVVVVVFLAGIYLVSATTVITDIQMVLGNVTIREDEIQVGNTMIGGTGIDVEGNIHASDGIGCGGSIGLFDVPNDAPNSLLGWDPNEVHIGGNSGTLSEPVFDEDIRVGIGTLTPSDKLHVFTTTPTYGRITIETTDANGETSLHFRDLNSDAEIRWIGQMGTTDRLGFFLDYFGSNIYGHEYLTILDIGNVGIADNTPDAKLEITPELTPMAAGPQDLLMISSTADADGDRVIVKNDGKVGIGTTSPDEELHVHKPQDAPTMIHVTNGENGANAKTGIKLDNSEIYVRPGLGGSSFVIHHNVQNAPIIFKISDGEMMRLQPSPSPRKVILGTGVDLWVDGNVCAANSGRETIAPGATSVVVSFPVSFIPANPDKIVVLVTPEWNTTVWVSTVDNWRFTVNFGTSPPSGNFFRWFALRTP